MMALQMRSTTGVQAPPPRASPPPPTTPPTLTPRRAQQLVQIQKQMAEPSATTDSPSDMAATVAMGTAATAVATRDMAATVAAADANVASLATRDEAATVAVGTAAEGASEAALATQAAPVAGARAVLLAALVAKFGATVPNALPAPAHRPLDFVELFAGDGAISKGMRLLGLKGASLDLRANPDHDFLSPTGLIAAMVAVLEVREGGVLWAAPPCSTWVWMSRHSTGRHLDVRGSGTPYVRSQNALVERLVLLLEIAQAAKVAFILEQPASSVLWQYPAYQEFCGRHSVATVALDMGAFGAETPKPMVLHGTAPYLQEMGRRLTPAERRELDRSTTAVHTTDGYGRMRSQGTKSLKGTQAYPLAFGAAHALAFRAATVAADAAAVASQAATVAADAAAVASQAATVAAHSAAATAAAHTAASAASAESSPSAAKVASAEFPPSAAKVVLPMDMWKSLDTAWWLADLPQWDKTVFWSNATAERAMDAAKRLRS